MPLSTHRWRLRAESGSELSDTFVPEQAVAARRSIPYVRATSDRCVNTPAAASSWGGGGGRHVGPTGYATGGSEPTRSVACVHTTAGAFAVWAYAAWSPFGAGFAS